MTERPGAMIPEQPSGDGRSVRVAALDCGTNSLRLLVADVDSSTGTVDEVTRQMQVVRLGQGVDRTGRFDPAALERTLTVTQEYAAVVRTLGAERIRFVATSATRDASNRKEFEEGVVSALGVKPEVVTGEAEAELSFRGASSAVATRHPGPFLVVDLGGGSTELVLGSGNVRSAVSMEVGCVRLTERHLHDDPPTPAQVAAARADVRTALDGAAERIPLGQVGTLVGVAGTVTTVAAHVLGLAAYDRTALDGTVLDADAVLQSCDDLMQRDRVARAALGFMHPGRVDVIAAGALVWREVIERVRAETAATGRSIDSIVVSEHDILDGIALDLAGG